MIYNYNKSKYLYLMENKVLSKYIIWVLRHGIVDCKLKINSEGYILVDDLLSLNKLKSCSINDIKIIVKDDNKNRFNLKDSNGKLYIRANQGHSMQIGKLINDSELLEEIINPLPMLIHGTNTKAYNDIKVSGLNPMNRKHIHFATGLPNDPKVKSGIRYTSKVLIFIDMVNALSDGKKFYKSTNGVVLSPDIIEPSYFKKVSFV